MSAPLRLRADDDYAAPVARVETTTVTVADGLENLVERTIVVYDAAGRIAEVSQNGPPALYRYEAMAPNVDRVTVSVNGEVVRELIRTTEADGVVSEETVYPPGTPEVSFPFEGLLFRIDGGERSVTRYVNGRFHSAEFHAAGAAIDTITSEHDAHGRLTRVVQTRNGHPVADLRRTYDDEHRVITSATGGDDMPDIMRQVVVDDAGHMIAEELTFFGNGRRTEYRYVLNSRGDWIERTAISDSVPVARTRRRITYR